MSEATQIVAIDGPAGAGKSTVARNVAEALGFAYLDTGAMYRAATWRALRQGTDLEDSEALAASTRAMQLDMQEENGLLRVFVDGEEVTTAIRTPEVTRLIYKLDQNSEVRRRLVELQRAFGERQPTVAEGRDIGTVVFPKARCKIYLDAGLEERARRRARQLAESGIETDIGHLMQEIHERDEKSKRRADSPLRQADDAVVVDTTGMSPVQVVQTLVELARERL
jgi:cytidylate kinase